MRNMLIQLQLSNYSKDGKFILECDSGWQMMTGRAKVMLERVEDLTITLLCPQYDQLHTLPQHVNPHLFSKFAERIRYVPTTIVPNALATRYDFNYEELKSTLFSNNHEGFQYDYVYINDPMQLRNFKALFCLAAPNTPKFFVHSHFIDDPSKPKFPSEASLWMGQCEAARKADFNFWQCGSSMDLFFEQMRKEYKSHIVDETFAKSEPWDDGYSSDEITNFDSNSMKNIRFDIEKFHDTVKNKTVIFVPNRIGKEGISSDYTNCGKFMFDILPKLRAYRNDYVVFCGNPSQKILNSELTQICGKDNYVSLVPDSLNRDEFKFVASHSHIAVGLYNVDSYGGTAARECIELGCLPFWVKNYEYETIAREVSWDPLYMSQSSLKSAHIRLDSLLIDLKNPVKARTFKTFQTRFAKAVRNRCSYEVTTKAALKSMGII